MKEYESYINASKRKSTSDDVEKNKDENLQLEIE